MEHKPCLIVIFSMCFQSKGVLSQPNVDVVVLNYSLQDVALFFWWVHNKLKLSLLLTFLAFKMLSLFTVYRTMLLCHHGFGC